MFFFKKSHPAGSQIKTTSRLLQKEGSQQGHKQKRQTVYFQKEVPGRVTDKNEKPFIKQTRLLKSSNLNASKVAQKSLEIAASLCIYTNDSITVLEI